MTEEYRINIMQDQAPITVGEATPEEETPVAGVMERLVALLIDGGVISIIYQLFLVAALRWWLQPDLEQIYWLLAGVNVPFILYETIFNSGGRNTLGRALVGIRVVNRKTAEPLTLCQAFLRAIGYYISAVLLLCGFLLAYIDTERRALHDYLAGSIVVQARKKSWLEKTVLTLTGLVLLTAFTGYFYMQIFGAGSFTQKRMVLRAQKHLEKIGFLEESHRIHFGYYTNDLLRLSILSGDPVQFQRDTQAVLDRKDFRIGVSDRSYKIKARAKDTRKTPVYYPSF